MSTSTLDPDNFPTDRHARNLPPGHDIRSLGPSDSSDSGSDMAGPGLVDPDLIPLEHGTHTDPETGRHDIADAGPSVGDLGMDADSDRYGTGEHLTAGMDPRIHVSADISVDRIVSANEAGLGGGLDQAEEALLGMTDEELEQALKENEVAGESDDTHLHRRETAGRA